MPNRHLSRICAMQSLYEFDLRPNAEILEIVERNIKERNQATRPKTLDENYLKNTIQGVIKNLKKIDKLIAQSAPEWPLEQISKIDKNILRIAIYELLYTAKKDHIPPKVAIDEAVEIAKTFGGENSSKFVNGVLGTIYRASAIYEKEKQANKKKPKEKSKN